MNKWFKFFLGTPQRALTTLMSIGGVMLVSHFFPGLLRRMLENAWHEVEPFISMVILLAIVWFGFQIIIGRGGKK